MASERSRRPVSHLPGAAGSEYREGDKRCQHTAAARGSTGRCPARYYRVETIERTMVGFPAIEAVHDGDRPLGLLVFVPGRWGLPHSWRAEPAGNPAAAGVYPSRAAALRALARKAVRP
jgi:hypothetical protein